MAQFKSFEPRAGVDEGLTIDLNTPRVEKRGEDGEIVLDRYGAPEYDRAEGAALSISEWPFTARSDAEERVLDNHPLVKQTSAQAAQEAQVQRSAEEADATPAAADLATQNNVDLTEVEGSGTDGKIIVSDVQRVIDEREAS